jgi:hypothetical protein
VLKELPRTNDEPFERQPKAWRYGFETDNDNRQLNDRLFKRLPWRFCASKSWSETNASFSDQSNADQIRSIGRFFRWYKLLISNANGVAEVSSSFCQHWKC